MEKAMKDLLSKLKRNLLRVDSQAAAKIAQIKNKIPENIEGEVPNFNWLEDGFLFKKMNPAFIEAFVNENDLILSQFDIKKYVGHGAVGDVWELDDGRILKVFDAGASVGANNESDLDKYKKIINLLHGGTGNETLPMVYEVDEFKLPRIFKGVRSRSKFNDGQFKPAYVILEKVNSFEDIVDENVENNIDRYDLQFDDEGNILNEENIYRPLTGHDVDISGLEKNKFYDAIDSTDYAEFTKQWLKAIMTNIMTELDSEYDNQVSGYEDYNNEDELDWNDLIKDPVFRDNLAKELTERFSYMDELDEDIINKFEYLMGLPLNWQFALAKAFVENKALGRDDLHLGNFGFRNNKVVFYDG